jgi:hypothetical protein
MIDVIAGHVSFVVVGVGCTWSFDRSSDLAMATFQALAKIVVYKWTGKVMIWRQIGIFSRLNISYHRICLLKHFTHPKGFIVVAQISSASHAGLNWCWYMRID